MHFEIIGTITDIETIAVGRQFAFFRYYKSGMGRGGGGNVKGLLTIRLANGRIRVAELHWYEAHGIGRKEMKRKRYLDKSQ